MNINGLMSLIAQPWQKPATDPVATEAIDPQTAPTPAAVYHPSSVEDAEPDPTYQSSVLEVWGFDQQAYDKADKEMMDLWWGGFARSTGELRYGYEDALKKISPELVAKDWGFSIRNDNLVIVPGDDALTDEEIMTLTDALGDLEATAQTLARDVVRYLELDRGTDGVSKRIGRFDVSQANFDQIIDMRELLLSHGKDAKYGRAFIQQSNYRGLYATAGYAIVDQIVARGEERFLATSPQRDYQTRVY